MEVPSVVDQDLDRPVSIIAEMETSMTLTGKRALVTGASRGIGAASARAQYITGSTFTVGGGANA
jgi:hypothetical protein